MWVTDGLPGEGTHKEVQRDDAEDDEAEDREHHGGGHGAGRRQQRLQDNATVIASTPST